MRRFWLLAIALLSAGRCAPVVDDGCPDLADLCPGLVCVEALRSDNGCALCECVIQACLEPSDCAERPPPQRCNLSVEVCEPAPECTDGADATLCPAACFGRCEEADAAGAPFCDVDADCAGSCRFDERLCVVDQGRCRGWCIEGCAEVLTQATDPQTQTCFEFLDSCVPPTFLPGCR